MDAIWIGPVFPSPQVDFGYDITDYESVDPQYGTLADLERLLAEAHKRQIRVLLDMVLNHTSDQHPWFLDAARARGSVAHPISTCGATADPTAPASGAAHPTTG